MSNVTELDKFKNVQGIIKFSKEQICMMNEFYAINPQPDVITRHKLARNISADFKKVTKWFLSKQYVKRVRTGTVYILW